MNKIFHLILAFSLLTQYPTVSTALEKAPAFPSAVAPDTLGSEGTPSQQSDDFSNNSKRSVKMRTKSLGKGPATPPVNKDYKPRRRIAFEGKLEEQIKWKSEERYQLSEIQGLKDQYEPGENVVWQIKGDSTSMEVTRDNGFDVLAFLTNGMAAIVIDASYDEINHEWEFSFNAPKNISKVYNMEIILYCGQRSSSCANVYGIGTEVREIILLNVW